jgi:indolepyruvate ferredoxin oxidoreductase, beta subunit
MAVQIHIAGVGGQGIISTGRLLLEAGLAEGKQVRGNETHGMSQRGGSVVFQVRIGDYKGVLIPEGEADILISTEPMEVVRYINMLKPGGLAILNTHRVVPAIINITKQKYPELEVLYDDIFKKTDRVLIIPAKHIAEEIKNEAGQNLILLGALVEMSDLINKEILRAKIKEKWPKVAERNLQAFDKGIEYAQKAKAEKLTVTTS